MSVAALMNLLVSFSHEHLITILALKPFILCMDLQMNGQTALVFEILVADVALVL